MNTQATIIFYTFPMSGHCHRVHWFLNVLGLNYELKEVNLRTAEQKSEAMLAMNPFGQVPILRDGDQVVSDSNAILLYLATRYAPEIWLPKDAVTWANLQRWFSVAAGLLAYGPATARAIVHFGRKEDMQVATARTLGLFAVMEAHLATHQFLLGDTISLADFANYAYVARANEGNIEMKNFPHINAWLNRLENTKDFLAMPKFN